MNLDSLWNDVISRLVAATGTAADSDDEGMRTADSADLLRWCDDLQDRVGVDVSALVPAMLAYIRARDARRSYAVGEPVIFANGGEEHEATIATADGFGFYTVICNGEEWSLVEAATMLRRAQA